MSNDKEVIKAKWSVAGDLVAGIDIDHIGKYQMSIVVSFDSKDECRDALTGKKLIEIIDAAF